VRSVQIASRGGDNLTFTPEPCSVRRIEEKKKEGKKSGGLLFRDPDWGWGRGKGRTWRNSEITQREAHTKRKYDKYWKQAPLWGGVRNRAPLRSTLPNFRKIEMKGKRIK